VVNFTPTLLEQLSDYAEQLQDYFQGQKSLKDPLLIALAAKKLSSNKKPKIKLMKDCLRANQERLIDPFPPYRRLVQMTKWYLKHPAMLIYLKDQYLFDILVWHHLAWMGETVRKHDRR